jgi:hypothetical protein
VGWVQNGEWLEYTINVEQAVAHTLSFLTATNAAGRGITIGAEKNGVFYATASTTVANTGSYTSFQPGTSIQMNLEAGIQTIRLTLTGGSFDLQSFTVTGPSTPQPTVQAPFGGTAPGFVGDALTVVANTFDEGGQGVAYNDNAGLDGGNTAFRPGRAVEFVGGGNDIGYVKPGEWVEYTINTPKAGVYDLSVLAKTPLPGVTVTISLGSGPALGTITLADGHAGGSSFAQAAFVNSAAAQVALGAGEQTIRLLLRFRPILMTTLAALFGALPLMLASGSGAELRQPLGLVMVGGLLVSQVLTLFTTPVIYLFFDRLGRRRAPQGSLEPGLVDV